MHTTSFHHGRVEVSEVSALVDMLSLRQTVLVSLIQEEVLRYGLLLSEYVMGLYWECVDVEILQRIER